MTKMTKEAAKELLANRKVYVNGKSMEIQEKLFECGFKWAERKVKVDNTHAPFLFIEDCIRYGCNMVQFGMHKAKEISAEEILSIEIEEGFKDGDFVFGGFSEIMEIYNSVNKNSAVRYHSALVGGELIIEKPTTVGIGYVRECKLANPKQRQLLIDELAKKGKRWNADKKCIEDLPAKPSEPKELKPFDRVLVRDSMDRNWKCEFFGRVLTVKVDYPFECTASCRKYCIPYEGNEHLLGTTNAPK